MSTEVSLQQANEIQPVEQSKAISSPYVILGITIAILLGLGLITLIVWLASSFPAEIQTIRDIFIIVIALETCLFGIILMVMMMMLVRLVNTIEFEIKPILEQTNETIGTVRGTTTFVSKNVVSPVVKATGLIVGFRKGVKVLFGNPHDNLPD